MPYRYYRPDVVLRITPCRESERLDRLCERLRGRIQAPTLVLVRDESELHHAHAHLLRHGLIAQALHEGVPHAFSAEASVFVAAASAGLQAPRPDLRNVYCAFLPASPLAVAHLAQLPVQDGQETLFEILATAADPVRHANRLHALNLSADELSFLLGQLTPAGALPTEDGATATSPASAEQSARVLAASVLHLAREVCLPADAVRRAVDALVQVAQLALWRSEPEEARVVPQASSREILARYDRRRAEYLEQLFRRLRREGDGFVLDIAETAAGVKATSTRVVAALRHLAQKGLIEVEMRGERRTYRLSDETSPVVPPSAILAELAARHEAALEDLRGVTALAEHAGCRWRQLTALLGSDFGRACAHCDWCLGVRPGLLPSVEQPDRLPAKSLAELRQTHPDRLATPRQAARLLVGHPSEPDRLVGLHEHPLAGQLALAEFDRLLRALERLSLWKPASAPSASGRTGSSREPADR